MFCSECGVENVDGSGSCRSCGSALGSAAVPVAAAVAAEAVAVEVEAAKTSKLAITAMVLGILSVFTLMLTALPAVICGVIALVKVSKSGGALKGKGFAIAGIATPAAMLPVLAVFAMLMAIMMPALGKTKEMAERVVCGTNMKGLGAAMMVYASDYNDEFPPADKWCDLLIAEVDVDPMMLKCRSASEGRCNYAMNENITKFGSKEPADMVLVFESSGGWNLSGGSELLTADNHCGEGANVLFADGHVEFVKSERFGSLNWGGEE